MVKLTLSISIAVLLSALALASDNWDIENRAVSENDLFGRELSEAEAVIFSRDIQELFARLPESLSQDEAHELVRRIHVSNKVKAGWHKFVNGIKNVGKTILSLVVREDAGLDAREPGDGFFGRAVRDELYERDTEEDLYLREFIGWEIDELD